MDVEILRVDARGRIVIPRAMRKNLGLKENAQVMLVCEPDNSELKILPLPFSEERLALKIKMLIRDITGSLARIAQVFADLGISLLYDETIVMKKGEAAEWTVIVPIPNMSLEDLTRHLKEKGGALRVSIIEPPKVFNNGFTPSSIPHT